MPPKFKKLKKDLRKQFKIVKPKIRKNIKIGRKKLKKLQPKARRISRNIDGYFDESSRQIREFQFRT